MYRSEYIEQELNPTWEPFTLDLLKLGGIDGNFTLRCYDWDATGGHDLIGEAFVSVRELSFGEAQVIYLTSKIINFLW